MQVFTVFKTDKIYSSESRELIGVCLTRKKVINLCIRFAKTETNSLKREQVILLTTTRKTAGYSGDGEFIFESVITDRII